MVVPPRRTTDLPAAPRITVEASLERGAAAEEFLRAELPSAERPAWLPSCGASLSRSASFERGVAAVARGEPLETAEIETAAPSSNGGCGLGDDEA